MLNRKSITISNPTANPKYLLDLNSHWQATPGLARDSSANAKPFTNL